MTFNGLDSPCRCSTLTKLLDRFRKLLHSYGIYQGIDGRIGTTYLIINLTVADLLVGTVSGPVEIFGQDLDLGNGLEMARIHHFNLELRVSPYLSLISLERLHATLFSFRHCLIEKWLYFKVIIGSWMITLLLAFTMSVLEELDLVLTVYSFACCTFLTVLIITVSYVIIIIKFKSNPPPQHSSAVPSERKLSVTLSMVTVVSILTILPVSISMAIEYDKFSQMSNAANFQITETLKLINYANSTINPLIYTIRMQEFTKAVKELCKGTAATRGVQPIERHAT